jgi:hypothetical protein
MLVICRSMSSECLRCAEVLGSRNKRYAYQNIMEYKRSNDCLKILEEILAYVLLEQTEKFSFIVNSEGMNGYF